MFQAVSPPLPHSRSPQFPKVSFVGLIYLFSFCFFFFSGCLVISFFFFFHLGLFSYVSVFAFFFLFGLFLFIYFFTPRSLILLFSGCWLCSFGLDFSEMASESKHVDRRVKMESDSDMS